jgi:hypothetical protein
MEIRQQDAVSQLLNKIEQQSWIVPGRSPPSTCYFQRNQIRCGTDRWGTSERHLSREVQA